MFVWSWLVYFALIELVLQLSTNKLARKKSNDLVRISICSLTKNVESNVAKITFIPNVVHMYIFAISKMNIQIR